MTHPSQALLSTQSPMGAMPVCDHYCGVESRMRKSLQMQAEMAEEFGTCVFDVTLDCEDGAPVGEEPAHAELVAQMCLQAAPAARVAVRVHPVSHASFEQDITTVVGKAGHRLAHVMIPKVESLQDILEAEKILRPLIERNKHLTDLKLHALIESPRAVANAFEIAAHPRITSLSFGLLDFVSAHGGAIPASAMSAQGQFSHPLVVRAKLEIAAACHAYGKTPSHCVVTEFKDASTLQLAAQRAAQEFGFMRMWSIHPDQIRPILKAFAPNAIEINLATKILVQASEVDWAPVQFDNQLHDRASYRYYWQVLQRAQKTGCTLPVDAQSFF